MAQIASLASVIGAGASIYGQVQQKQDAEKRQKEAQRQQAVQQAAQVAERQAQVDVRNAATVADEAARAEQLRLADEASRAQRDATLKRTIAQARARLAAGGVDPSGGSAQALVDGLQQDAAASDAQDSALLNARLAANRRSLLQPASGSFATSSIASPNYLTLGNSVGALARNLLG
ncbi:hypothetical protein [Plastoroseomonas arctica]|uniref:Internal virion protein n=1 Tax=Plastoroseomonas arctica TaxID=1509237 RepID=A0AAF1KLJ6_9PROT|nr:hypothetical protein [Plastoroseomonas arctica]MBR0654791.1 hypothetical protein [Plastoroseomonas arctica]